MLSSEGIKEKEEEKKAIKDLVSPSAQESAEDLFIYLFIWTEGESETARDKEKEKNFKPEWL